MNLNEIATDNRILEYEIGSRLYGTNTPESDIDLSGIFIAPKEFYLGLKTVNEIDLSIVSKNAKFKNDKDAVDRKLYELRKFVKLAADNNPNIIEQLFVQDKNIKYISPLGSKLLANRHLFPHKGAFKKFIGYAVSQKKKMCVKSGNMNDIVKAIMMLKNFKEHDYVVQYKNEIFNQNFQHIKDTSMHIQIGDICIQKNDTVKKALNKLENRKDKFSSRYDDYVSKAGFDLKFASNLIRLLYEGKELLETGKITFPLKCQYEILAIKKGDFTLDEIFELSAELENQMTNICERSDLPDKPQMDKIENLLIELVEESWENA